MKRILQGAIIISVLILSLGHALTEARTGSGAQSRKSGRKNAEERLAKGREVYLANCARCHGGDGLGNTRLGETFEVPDITDAKWQSRRSDRRLTQSVVRGRGQMPAFGGKLSKEEVAAVVAYVRSLRVRPD